MPAAETLFVDRIEFIAPLPQVVPQLLAVTSDPDTTCDQVTAILNTDPAVAAKILRVANSAFYGAPASISQVDRAVVRLGTVTVRNMAVGMCVRDAVQSWGQWQPHQTALWRHAIATAAGCDLIARRTGIKPPEEALVAGLLHDIGQLAMAAYDPDKFAAIAGEQGRTVGFLELEIHHFGIDHTTAGHQMLQRWGLPESLCRAVQKHHQSRLEQDDDLLLAVVIMGDVLAQLLGLGMDFFVTSSPRGTSAAERLGLSQSDQFELLGQIKHHMKLTEAMLGCANDAHDTGSTDEAPQALWVCDRDGGDLGLAQLLLEHAGYEVSRLSYDMMAQCEPNCCHLVFIEGSDDEPQADALAVTLQEQGHQSLVVLVSPREGRPVRQRDENTGACHIPVTFNAFDLHWVEQELKHGHDDSSG